MKKKYGLIVKLVAFFVLCLVFVMFVNSKINIKKGVEHIDMGKSANLYYNGQIACVGNINKYNIQDVQYGDEIRIEKRIHGKKIVNPIIAFNNDLNLAYEIRIDNKKVTSLGMGYKKNSVVCDEFVFIPVKDIQDKKIDIIFKVMNEKHVKYLPKIIYINGLQMVQAFFTSNIEYVIIGMLLIEIGMIMFLFMILNVILKVFNIKNLYIALFSIFAGIWLLCCFQSSMYIFKNRVVDFYLEYIAFAFTLIFANLYAQELYKDEKIKDVLRLLNMILIITTTIVVFLQVFNKVYIGDSIIAVRLHAIPILLLLVKKYIDRIQVKEKKCEALIIRGVIIVGLIIVCLRQSIYSNGQATDILNGMILVYVMIIYQAIYAVVVEMNEEYIIHAEKKGVVKLAYLDTLTGISNRRGMEKYVDEIEDRQIHTIYNVCSFDLNKLKNINDTYGHSAGDILIKDFAKALECCVDTENEYCGRMGGDEFIAIVLDNRLDEFIKDLEEYVKSRNENGEFKYEVSYSYGVSTYESFAGKDINDSIRLADYFMYDMKSAYQKKESRKKKKKENYK